VGPRVLEVPCGTGNLLLDMLAAGHAPVGVDLSSEMLGITLGKLRRNQRRAPLVRARAQRLPFASGTFDSVVMTFPPGFVSDATAFAEVRRVLDDRGRLIWVDSARFSRPPWWGRLVNEWIGFQGSTAVYETLMREVLAQAGLDARIEWVQDDSSAVVVAIATKAHAPNPLTTP
jgi:ubiquinone/menaquinone biosynthesis C-methylase UbiE